MVLNAATRLVVRVRRYEHITLALRDVLHWLPVSQRIQFKMAIFAFDCVREHCPACLLQQRLHPSRRHFWSGKSSFGRKPRHDSSTRTQLGRRSFHAAAPAVWNALPSHPRSSSISRGQFRAGLKTHIFTQAYGHLWELLLKSVLFYITFTYRIVPFPMTLSDLYPIFHTDWSIVIWHVMACPRTAHYPTLNISQIAKDTVIVAIWNADRNPNQASKWLDDLEWPLT